MCGLGYYMANRATKGRPSGLQVAFEALTAWVQNQTKEGMGVRTPRGVVGFCVTVFAFILTATGSPPCRPSIGSRRRPRTSTSSTRWRCW